jgi:hypothetical protein
MQREGKTISSVWKHPRSQYWTACFRDATGRRRRISTKETNQFKAGLIASAYERVSRKQRTKFHTRQIIAHLHEELGGEPIWAASTLMEIGGERRQHRLALLEEELTQLPNGDCLPPRFWSIVRGIGCTCCGFNKWPQILQFHHIDKNRKNNSLDNLTVLCPNCHRALHQRIAEIEFKSLAQLLFNQDFRIVSPERDQRQETRPPHSRRKL